MTKPRSPKQPLKFRFGEMSDDDFEEMVFQLVRLEFPGVNKPKAPDGGVDTIFINRDNNWGWQAKRYTGTIYWAKCKESFDRAVDQYGVTSFTLCFARELTVNQIKYFIEHFTERHPGVAVSYWDSAELTARLDGSEEGKAVARRYFEDQDLLEKLERAQRAGGGALGGVEDVHERTQAIGEHQAGLDPDFAYTVTTFETGQPEPDKAPGTLISVAEIGRVATSRTDAAPRNPDEKKRLAASMSRIEFTDDEDGKIARKALQRIATHGGKAELPGGLRTTLANLPKGFEKWNGKTYDEAVIIARDGKIDPWSARAVVETDRGRAELIFVLSQAEAPAGMEFLLNGAVGAATLRLGYYWRDAEDKGGISMNFGRSPDAKSPREEAEACAFLYVLHGAGKLTIEDLSGNRPLLTQELNNREAAIDLFSLTALYGSVATLEERSGAKVEIPDVVQPDELAHLAAVAEYVYAGERHILLESLEVTVTPENPMLHSNNPTGFTFGGEATATVLGQTLDLGKVVRDTPPLKVVKSTSFRENGEELVKVLLKPFAEEVSLMREVLLPTSA